MSKYQVNITDWSQRARIPQKIVGDLKNRRSTFIENSRTEKPFTVH